MRGRWFAAVIAVSLSVGAAGCQGLFKFSSSAGASGGSGSGGGSSGGDSSGGGSSGGDSSGGAPAVHAGGTETRTAPVTKPSWCGSYHSTGDESAQWVDSYIHSEGFTLRTLSYIAKAGCDKPGDAERQKQVAGWRQQWMDYIGTNDAEDRRSLAAYIDSETYEKNKDAFCKGLKPDDDASQRDKELAKATMTVANCGESVDLDVVWWIDRPDAPEIMKTAFVASCLQYPGDSYMGDDDEAVRHRKDEYLMAHYAVCGVDGRKLDKTKFEQELRAQKFPEEAQVEAIEVFSRTKKITDSLTEYYKKLASKDDAYQALLFDAPEKGWADWTKLYQANQKRFDLAWATMDKSWQGSKKAMAGCGKSLRDLWFGYVKSKKPKTEDEVKAVATDAVGYPLALSLMVCDSLENRFLSAGILYYDILKEARVSNGPRMAAYWAAVEALTAVAKDRENFKIEGKDLPDLVNFDAMRTIQGRAYGNDVSFEEAKGVIASVKPKGEQVEVSFKTESWKEPVYDCKETHKIDRIDENGNIIYRENCHQKGSQTMKSKERPVLVPKEFAEGLKPGQFGKFTANSSKNPREGIPMKIFTDKKQTKLVSYFGIKL